MRYLFFLLSTTLTAQHFPPYQQQALSGEVLRVVPASADIITWSSPLPDAINVHLVRGPEGTILFDALRRSDQVDALKPVLDELGVPQAVLITHAHTDHYGGLYFLRGHYPNLPIYSSVAVRREIELDEVPDAQARRALFGSRFPTQSMIEEHLPTELLEDAVTVTVAGLRILPLLMEASESKAAVVYYLPELEAAIVGDLVNVLTISAPTLSLATWLTQLDRLERMLPPTTTLYVGHGPSGPAKQLIDDQRDFLVLLRDRVMAAAADEQGVSAAEKATIVRYIRLAYPHHRGAAFLGPDELIGASIDWVAAQLTEQ